MKIVNKQIVFFIIYKKINKLFNNINNHRNKKHKFIKISLKNKD